MPLTLLRAVAVLLCCLLFPLPMNPAQELFTASRKRWSCRIHLTTERCTGEKIMLRFINGAATLRLWNLAGTAAWYALL